MQAEEFKSIRESLGMSQSELAEALGLSSSRVVRAYELGERPISGPIQLCLKYMLKFGPI